jgi:hypothetical protein
LLVTGHGERERVQISDFSENKARRENPINILCCNRARGKSAILTLIIKQGTARNSNKNPLLVTGHGERESANIRLFLKQGTARKSNKYSLL